MGLIDSKKGVEWGTIVKAVIAVAVLLFIFVAIIIFLFPQAAGQIPKFIPFIEEFAVEEAKCVDSDAGKVYDVAGFAATDTETKDDTCDVYRLNEVYCEDDVIREIKRYDCRAAGFDTCLDGACTNVTCEDDDAGKIPWMVKAKARGLFELSWTYEERDEACTQGRAEFPTEVGRYAIEWGCKDKKHLGVETWDCWEVEHPETGKHSMWCYDGVCESIKCVDTDDRDYEVFGTTSGIIEGAPGVHTRDDECAYGTVLREYYCKEDGITITSEEVDCTEEGFKLCDWNRGICANEVGEGEAEAEAEGEPAQCIDTDGGKVYDKKGSTTGETQGAVHTLTDVCIAGGTALREYFCKADGISLGQEIKECICINGACVG